MRPCRARLPHRPVGGTADPVCRARNRTTRTWGATLCCLLAALCLASPFALAAAEETASPDTSASPHAPDISTAAASAASGAAAASATAAALPVPKETSKVTEHAIVIDGRRLAYRSTAGTLVLRDAKGEPDASMFYVAYTARAGNATLITCDAHFNGLPDVMLVEKIKR